MLVGKRGEGFIRLCAAAVCDAGDMYACSSATVDAHVDRGEIWGKQASVCGAVPGVCHARCTRCIQPKKRSYKTFLSLQINSLYDVCAMRRILMLVLLMESVGEASSGQRSYYHMHMRTLIGNRDAGILL